MKKVRTCNGCRALNFDNCTLGYKIIHDDKKDITYLSIFKNKFKPMSGECDKPKTNSQMVELFLRNENENL